MNEDWLAKVRLHAEFVDWTDPSLTRDTLTRKFSGPWDYLPKIPGTNSVDVKKAIQTEIKILRKAGYSQWGKSSPYKPYYQHVLTLMKLLLPRRDINPNTADITMFFCECFTRQRKLLNLIGSQNSGKTTQLAQLALLCLVVSPENTAVYAATPNDKAGGSTLWGDLLKVFYGMKAACPWLWVDVEPYADKYIKFDPKNPKAALLEYRGVKDVGKFMGMKTEKEEGEGDPLILVEIDEVNRIVSQDFIDALANLHSQDGFLGFTSQNFSDETSMGGALTAPHPLYPGNPKTFNELDKDTSNFWHSYLDGITVRFNGLLSPNIKAGRDIYPYLFTQKNLADNIRHYTKTGLKYYEQVLSFPYVALGEATVLDHSRRESSRYKDAEFAIDRIDFRTGFLDPAFSGQGDKAVWHFAEFGKASSVTSTGRQREHHPLVNFTRPPVYIRIDIEAVFDDDWLDKFRDVGADVSQIHRGSPVSVDEQLAVESAMLNKTYNVPPQNFGYDFSMRPGIVSAMNNIAGRSTVPFSYPGPPEGYFLEHFKANSEDECFNRLSELAYLVADLFCQKAIRGGQHIEVGATQLCRTRVVIKAKKHKIEDKVDYKARHQGHSPDERDTLMGVVGMGYLRGFKPASLIVLPDVRPQGPKKNPFLTSRRPAFH